METIYRDYGKIGNKEVNNGPFNVIKHRLVYLATHGGDDKRLPYMYRSFISFSFGGKLIEDFDLIATITSDKLSRNGYADFKDNTSTYDNLDGLYYWSTHYTTNSLEFTLATDGIELKMLDNFLSWFQAGITRELILSEHPNRAILARVSSPPALNLLPFEEPIEVTVAGFSYTTSTTLYKGDITLKFIMDSPFWYSKTNILGILDSNTNRYVDNWIDLNGKTVNIFLSKDALKILYEDGIPLGSSINYNMLLGNGEFANVEDNIISRICNDLEEGAHIEEDDAVPPYLVGVIAGAVIEANGTISSLITFNKNDESTAGYFYYSGTAPAPTIISFELTPNINSNGYINTPGNSNTNSSYNIITIESTTKLQLLLTTPNIYTSFNKAIKIFKTQMSKNIAWEDIRNKIRDNVRHKYAREWAIYTIDSVANGTEKTPDTDSKVNTAISNLCSIMTNFIKTDTEPYTIEPVYFEFNSETGEAIGKFNYRILAVQNNVINVSYITELEEDVGDMLRSNYIILRDRNTSNKNGFIVRWDSKHPDRSYRIYHNFSVPLKHISIRYKNMYL